MCWTMCWDGGLHRPPEFASQTLGDSVVIPPASHTSERTSATRRIVWAVLLLCLLPTVRGLELNSFISYYEPAYYNTSEVTLQLAAARTKRSADYLSHTPLHINFKAHERLFRLRLKRGAESLFSPDVSFESSRGRLDFQTHRVVVGDIQDDSSSSVDGILQSNGVFDGHIQTKDGVFYVEPASRYFSEDPGYPVVVYHENHVVHPVTERPRPTCVPPPSVIINSLPASTAARYSQQPPRTSSHGNQSIMHAASSVNSSDSSNASRSINGTVRFSPDFRNQLYESLEVASLEAHGILQTQPSSSASLSATHQAFTKTRRSADGLYGGPVQQQQQLAAPHVADYDRGNLYESRKTTCLLYLQADHLFYENMGRSEEACIDAMTRHVQRVNSIYRSVDFDMDGKPDNISFMIKRIKVHTEESLADPSYRFPGNYGVEKFLEIFSEEDYDAFCLAYMFTYRDFEGGTLGLAWTGDLKNAGGVCEKNGHYRGSFKSLNTGVITLLNYGKHVPPAVSHVTMAHEMGHNFGSPHDPETVAECVPGGDDGNYIMFARATSGDKFNNKRFSPCSLTSINKVLQSKARGPKGCFKEPQMAICGNGVVEEGEECDCGWEEDCLEDCCWPQRTKFLPNQLPCTLKPGKQCSPSQGPCCSRHCSYQMGNKCREDNGCRDESYCNGRGTACPPSQLKPNKTVCHDEFVCFLGECTGSICLAYGMESCQCDQGPDDSPTKACELCCKEPGEGNPCLSSFQLNEPPLDVPDMYSKPGTPCNNYQGYCDVFQKCREVDPSGPLATLRKILLSDKSIASLKKFLTDHWYAAVLAVIAVIGLMIAIVKLCGKKTPLVTTRRHRRRTVHHRQQAQEENFSDPEAVHVHHPPAVKSRIPFLGRRYRIHKEKSRDNQRRDRTRKSSAAVEVLPSAPPLDGGEHYRRIPSVGTTDRAASLARGLTRLIVALPAASQESDVATVVGEGRSAAAARSQSADTERKDRSVSPAGKGRRHRRHHKEDKDGSGKTNSKSPLAQMKRLSKSATTLSKSFEKLEGHAEGGGMRKRKHRSKSREPKAGEKGLKATTEADQHKEGAKEVTIAKLGPFKMSLELRAETGNRMKEVAAAAASGLQKAKGGGSGELTTTRTKGKGGKEKEKPLQQQRRRRKSVGHDEKQTEHEAPSKQKPTNITEVTAAATEMSPKSETIVSAAEGAVKKAKKTSKAERIIVSKLAKSDRPRRESVQQQQVMETVGLEDYRLTLNKRKQSTTTTTTSISSNNSHPPKYSRSISQPNPPSSSEFVLSELIVTGSSELGRKPAATATIHSSSSSSRLAAKKKKHATSLSQSDRIGAVNVKQLRRSSTAREASSSGATFSLCPPDSGSSQAVFDNPAFDTSPDLLRRRLANQEHQDGPTWRGGDTAATGSRSLLHRQQQQPSDYSLMEQSSSSSQSETEDSSEDNKRRSPPTQTQSLSEGSSEELWRGRRGGRPALPSAHFDSDSDDLSDLDKESSCNEMPQYAANPYVRVPHTVLSLIPTNQSEREERIASSSIDAKETSSPEGCSPDRTVGCSSDRTETLSIITDGVPVGGSPDFTTV